MTATTLRIDFLKNGYVVTPSTNDINLSVKIGKIVDKARETLDEKIEWNKRGYMKNKEQAIQYKNTIADLLKEENINFTDLGIIEV